MVELDGHTMESRCPTHLRLSRKPVKLSVHGVGRKGVLGRRLQKGRKQSKDRVKILSCPLLYMKKQRRAPYASGSDTLSHSCEPESEGGPLAGLTSSWSTESLTTILLFGAAGEGGTLTSRFIISITSCERCEKVLWISKRERTLNTGG